MALLPPQYEVSDESGDEDATPLEVFEAYRKAGVIPEDMNRISLKTDEPVCQPGKVLVDLAPFEAQEQYPIYGPLGVGDDRPGGLYRKFRNHEMGHLKLLDPAAGKERLDKLRRIDYNPESDLVEKRKQDEIFRLNFGRELTQVSSERLANDDPASAEFVGPWAPYVGELERKEELRLITQEQATATAAVDKIVENIIPKDDEDINENSTVKFHTKDLVNYQGKSWVYGPPVTRSAPTEQEPYCQLPKKVTTVFSGHNKGVSRIRWFPNSGHLLLSCSSDNTLKIWSIADSRRLVATYAAHNKSIKDCQFTSDGLRFYSASFDTTIKLWDTEYGKVINTFGNDKIPFSVSVHPDPKMQNVIIAACQNKKAIQYDANTGKVVQEYNEHLAVVNTATFCEDGKKIVTTADDKKMFVWEFGIGVVVKHIAEPYMNAIPAVQLDPFGKFLACQSMDNQIVVYEGRGRFRLQSKKRFKGHMCTGYSILPGFSPDCNFILSGDSSGRCWFWDWKTSKVHRSLTAHDGVCMAAIWHPHQKSMVRMDCNCKSRYFQVATCGWDGLIKLWE